MNNAEAAVIAALMKSPDHFYSVSAYLTDRDFADPFYAKAFAAIGSQIAEDRAVDAVTLAEDCDLDMARLIETAANYPATNLDSYARIVKTHATSRTALAKISEHQEAIGRGDAEALSRLQLDLEKLSGDSSRSGYLNFAQTLRAGMGDVEEAMERLKTGVTGLTFNLPELDRALGGVRGPKLIILAARPSLGKTALGLQLALTSANHGHPVGMVSLEMSAAEIAIRSMAHEYSVNNTALSRGDAEAVNKVARAAKERNIKDLPLFIDEDTYTVGGIVARAVEWHRRHGIKALIVDHLQLVEVSAERNRNDALGDVTRALKLLAKRLNIPVVLVCQLNRLVEREKRRPKLSDLRDSGNIEQDADIVMMLHGELEGTDGRADRDVEIGLLKYRGGRVGWLGAPVIFDGATQRFTELADADGVWGGS